VRVFAGVGLVLATWTVIAFSLVSMGLLLASLVGGSANRVVLLRRAIWWGLLVATIEICALSLVVPLHSAKSAVAIVFTIAVLGIPGWIRVIRASPARFKISASKIAVLGALAVAQLYLALAALGPVTGYDSGLYHLGSIRYASDFSALPGLANLYGPLGYSTAQFPLAAALGNGPWGIEGFRLLNGLILGLVALDLALRLIARKSTPGLYILLVGVAAAWIPMVALSDFWVTSPSQDSAVLALTIVSVSYLADACSGRSLIPNASIAIVAGISIVLIRSTMAMFLISTLAIAVVLVYRSRATLARRLSLKAGFVLLLLSSCAALVMAGRDYILSGWLLYPLSVLPFGVSWRATDPESLRMATLGFARDPARTWESISGWEWVGAWISRLPSQWVFWEFVALSGALVVTFAVIVAFKLNLRAVKWVLLAMVPSVVTVVVWWTTSPPAFRFIWGPLFSLAAIPIGAGLWRLSRRDVVKGNLHKFVFACAAVPILLVTLYSATTRFDSESLTEHRAWVAGVSVPYAVAPIPLPPTQRASLSSGIQIASPTETDQCWGQYPLCTPQTTSTLRFLGDSLSGGFLG
jgi:hypothetical protein